MDLLEKALQEALVRNAEEKDRWTAYKQDHIHADQNINSFQKSLQIDIMVPIGSKAFMPGSIYHTGEILVSHSQSIYSKCTAHMASNICKHRLKIAQQRQDALETEYEMYKNKLEIPFAENAFTSDENKEIIEPYNEEEEKLWQERHAQNMKEYKRIEALERQNQTPNKEETDLWDRLEELELIEELNTEMETLNIEENETITKLMSGEIEVSEEKQRISHIQSQTNDTQPQSVTTDKNEAAEADYNLKNTDNTAPADYNLKSTAIEDALNDINENSETESQLSDDDVPPEFKELVKTADKLTNEEKLKFYKKHLSDIQLYLESTNINNFDDYIKKTDKMFLSDYLLNIIDEIRDKINDNSVYEQNTTPKEINGILNQKQQNYPKLGQKNKNIKRKVSFSDIDTVQLFNENEEPNKFSYDLGMIENNNRKDEDPEVEPINGPTLTIRFSHSKNKRTWPSEDSDLDNNHLIDSPADIYDYFSSMSFMTEKNQVMEHIKHIANLNLSNKGTIANENIPKTNEKIQNNKISPKKTEVTIKNTCTQNSLDKKPILKNNRENVVVKKEDVAVKKENVGAKKENVADKTANEVVDKENMDDKKENVVKSIDNEREDHIKEFNEVMGDIFENIHNISSIPPSTEPIAPEALPEGNFVDAFAPKKRISRFKASRQK